MISGEQVVAAKFGSNDSYQGIASAMPFSGRKRSGFSRCVVAVHNRSG